MIIDVIDNLKEKLKKYQQENIDIKLINEEAIEVSLLLKNDKNYKEKYKNLIDNYIKPILNRLNKEGFYENKNPKYKNNKIENTKTIIYLLHKIDIEIKEIKSIEINAIGVKDSNNKIDSYMIVQDKNHDN